VPRGKQRGEGGIMAANGWARCWRVGVCGGHVGLMMHVARVVLTNLVHAVLVLDTEANPRYSRYSLLTVWRRLMVMQRSAVSCVSLRSVLGRRGFEGLVSVHGRGVRGGRADAAINGAV
jgi:hypothetical protein